MPNEVLTRDDLIQRLAKVSHESWMRQKREDPQFPRDSLPTEVTRHDIERAGDIVAELELLGLVRFEVS